MPLDAYKISTVYFKSVIDCLLLFCPIQFAPFLFLNMTPLLLPSIFSLLFLNTPLFLTIIPNFCVNPNGAKWLSQRSIFSIMRKCGTTRWCGNAKILRFLLYVFTGLKYGFITHDDRCFVNLKTFITWSIQYEWSYFSLILKWPWGLLKTSHSISSNITRCQFAYTILPKEVPKYKEYI